MKPKAIAGIIGAIVFVAVGWCLFPGIIESAVSGVAK